MKINKVDIVVDKNGTQIKINDEKLQGVTFFQLKKSSAAPAELTISIDVIPEHVNNK